MDAGSGARLNGACELSNACCNWYLSCATCHPRRVERGTGQRIALRVAGTTACVALWQTVTVAAVSVFPVFTAYFPTFRCRAATHRTRLTSIMLDKPANHRAGRVAHLP